MKFLLVLTLCLGSVGAFADEHMEGKTFEEKKARFTQHLDERLAHVNEAKSCVAAATDEAGLKACKEKMRAHGKEMRNQWKAKKEEMKAKKEETKANKKKK